MNHNIAIDGPAGAGKSTIAKLCAKALGSVYVDTGAMYRAIAIHLLRKGCSGSDAEAVGAALADADVTIAYAEGKQCVFLNGEDVTGILRREEVGNMASTSSAIPAVRKKLLSLQRDLAAKQDVVMDGRDIGTVILPDAQLKIFLTASVEERARRRYKELVEKGETPDIEAIRADIEKRDHQDSTRAESPLRQADDAVFVDSSDLSINEVTDLILRLFYEKNGIRIAKSAGFCFGVRRAMQLCEECLEKCPRPIYTLGPIIHNEAVVTELAERGISPAEEEELLGRTEGTVILRSHGVTKETYERFCSTGLTVADATCPFVEKIHKAAAEQSALGRTVVIIGDPLHPEVIGTMGWSESPCYVVSTEEEAAALPIPKTTPLCVVAQTTFHSEKFKDFVEIIKHLGYDTLVLNTICHATSERQSEAGALAEEADIMLVVGSRSSSNTRKLYEICKERCADTYYIQSPEDLKSLQFPSDRCVGITAGASTPNNIIQEVSKECRKSRI